MKHEVFTPGQEAFIKSMYGVGSRDKDAMEALSSYWLLVDDLSEKLSAELARRMKAEEVVERADTIKSVSFRGEVRAILAYDLLMESIRKYRAQYPRVEKGE